LEILFSFLVGFITTWFLIRDTVSTIKTETCPQKETITRLVEVHVNDKRMMREIREYSLLKIQEGHYEYGEVLTALTKKEKV
jgi:hypothetical protein